MKSYPYALVAASNPKQAIIQFSDFPDLQVYLGEVGRRVEADAPRFARVVLREEITRRMAAGVQIPLAYPRKSYPFEVDINFFGWVKINISNHIAKNEGPGRPSLLAQLIDIVSDCKQRGVRFEVEDFFDLERELPAYVMSKLMSFNRLGVDFQPN